MRTCGNEHGQVGERVAWVDEPVVLTSSPRLKPGDSYAAWTHVVSRSVRWVPASFVGCAVSAEAKGRLTSTPQALRACPAPVMMFTAALSSRSSWVVHSVHVHSRTSRGLGPSRTPHTAQVWEV